MVDISQETPAEVETRLKGVTRLARLELFNLPFAFEEFPLSEFKLRADPEAFALVRDDKVWSQLKPAGESPGEVFAVWRYHFPEGVDNSGFVGWLASSLKQWFGTGVFVICGSNHNDGGVFDYWGCPWSLRDQVFECLLLLTPPRA